MTKQEAKDLQPVLGNSLRYADTYGRGELKDWARVSYGSFERSETGTIYIPNLLSGSDYSGSSVERSNHRVWCEQFKSSQGELWWDLYGGWGTFAIAIDAERATDDMIEVLSRLADYPLISESDLSELEHELENEAWDSYIESDFTRALRKKFCNGESDEENEQNDSRIDALSSDELYELFSQAMETSNTYYEHETGGSVYVDIDRVLEAIPELPKPTGLHTGACHTQDCACWMDK